MQDFGALLNAASSGLSTLGDRVLKPLRVTSAQWKVLVVLARRGPSRVSDLVQCSSMIKPPSRGSSRAWKSPGWSFAAMTRTTRAPEPWR